MKIKQVTKGWYQMVRDDGVYAGFRSFGRNSWGVYFRNADKSCAFGMQPGDEYRFHSRNDAIAFVRQVLVENEIRYS